MIFEIEKLDKRDLQSICSKAKSEGHNHIDRLIHDYETGVNRFDLLGEILIGCMPGDEIVGVCGINIEPENPNFGRIRRLYVLPSHRTQGIGSKLVRHLISCSVDHFSAVTVNIGRLPVDRFYTRLGFKKTSACHSFSYILKIKK